MESITALELQDKIKTKQDFLLIDVREDFEHENFNIGGKLMPMGTIAQHLAEVPNNKPVIIYCEKGIRSVIVIQKLEQNFGYTNLINLTGGMQAWRKQVI